jgi:ribosomal subunit interface protein
LPNEEGLRVDIVVKGRHTEVADGFRSHVQDKLAKVGKLDAKVSRIDVEVDEEHNPRLADQRSRVELTCRTRGPVVRAEACAPDPYAALDLAASRLEARLRKAADRRRVHHGIRTPVSVATATAHLNGAGTPFVTPLVTGADPLEADELEDALEADAAPQPFVVREKDHTADPMTLEQALFAMELVGHDFFLFVDAERGVPSVVYRRHGYDYGVIRLVTTGDTRA